MQEVILSRENFKVGTKEWAKSIATEFGCCCRLGRKDKLLKKGMRKIKMDLDLRTYMKAIRHLQIMQNVLLTDR